MPRRTRTETEGNDITDEKADVMIKDKVKTASGRKKESEGSLSLEEAFVKLDQIIGGLEREDVSLEDSFKLYHEGMELLKTCNQSIDKVEKELIILEESMNG